MHITTVYMPLVRTPMIAPTKMYDRFPTLSPDEAAELITDAIRKRPKRVGDDARQPRASSSYAIAPGAQDLVMHDRAYQAVPRRDGEKPPSRRRAEQRAFVRATRGVHW